MGIRGDPGFVGLCQIAAGGHHRPLDSRALGGWDSFAVEYAHRHLKTVAVATLAQRPGRPIVADHSANQMQSRDQGNELRQGGLSRCSPLRMCSARAAKSPSLSGGSISTCMTISLSLFAT